MIKLSLAKLSNYMKTIKTWTQNFLKTLAVCYFRELWACSSMPDHTQQKSNDQKKSFLDCLTKWKKPIPNNLTLSWVLLMDLFEILIRVKAMFKFHYKVVSNIMAKAEASKHCFPRQCLSNLLAKVIWQFSVLASANTMAVSGSYLGNVLHKSQVKRLGN